MTKALGAVAAVCFTLAGTAAGTAVRPTLRLVSRAPVAVRGTNFRPAEQVRIVLAANTRHLRVVRATARGSFVARFAGVELPDRCSSLVVQANGARGSRALLRVRPLCPPA